MKPPAPLRTLTPTAWGLVLIASPLADVACSSLPVLAGVAGRVWIARLILLAAGVLATRLASTLRPLFPFATILLAIHAVQAMAGRVDFTLPWLAQVLGGWPFAVRMQPVQTGKLAVALLVIALMFLLGFRRATMFLVRGDVRARIAPVPWMGFPKADTWVSFGGQYSIYLALGVAAAMWFSAPPPAGALGRLLPALPAVLLLAAINAFNEELIFRSCMVGPLLPVLGRRTAWWISAAAFGLAHYYGVPGGWLGIGLAGFIGWLLAKAMLETRGFFWPWWIHWLLDVAIFSAMAMAG